VAAKSADGRLARVRREDFGARSPAMACDEFVAEFTLEGSE
jgi:hypothetical protein